MAAYISFQPKDYYNTKIWGGDSTSPINITGVGFQPDFIWGKLRNIGYAHQLYDSVRGFGNNKELNANENIVEGGGTADQYGYLSGVVADGFTATAGSDSGADKYGYWNESARTYVAWNWKAGTTSGIAGSPTITPTSYSFNATSGFSIIAYTGTATNATLPHGLGVAPKMIIQKNLADTESWMVYHASLGATKYMVLNTTAGSDTNSTRWNDTEPDATVFSIGTDSSTNGSGETCIAYCFAEKSGYSKFGSYIGNGDAEGPFVYTGFRPAFFMLKKSSGPDQGWLIVDDKRGGYNTSNDKLYADSSAADTLKKNSLLSNGWKVEEASDTYNASGATYIYAAFAEFPLVSSNNIPGPAR